MIEGGRVFLRSDAWVAAITVRHAGFLDGPRFESEEEAHAHLREVQRKKIAIRYQPGNPDVSIEA